MIIREEYLIKLNVKDRVQRIKLKLDYNSYTNVYSIYKNVGQWNTLGRDYPNILIKYPEYGMTLTKYANYQFDKLIKKAMSKGYKSLSSLTNKNLKEDKNEEEVKNLLIDKPIKNNGFVPRVMWPVSHERCFSQIFAKDYLISPKIDGIRAVIYKEGNIKCILQDSKRTDVSNSMSHILDNIKNIFEENPHLILDGYIFIKNIFYNKKSILNNLLNNTDCSILEFWVYDCISDQSCINRYEYLQSLNFNSNKIICVQQCEKNGLLSITKLCFKLIQQGYSGILAKNKTKKYIMGTKSSHLYVEMDTHFESKFKIISLNREIDGISVTLQNIFKETFKAKLFGIEQFQSEYLKRETDIVGKQAICVYNDTKDGLPLNPVVKSVY